MANAKNPPGPKGRAYLKFIQDIGRDYNLTYLGLHATYGDLIHYRLRGQNVYVVYDPEFLAQILRKGAKNFHKSPFMQELKPLLEEGLLLTEDEVWKTQRRLVGKAFHNSAIANNIDTMAAITENYISEIPENESFDIANLFTELTMQIAGNVFLGEPMGKSVNTVKDLLPVASEIAVNRISSPLTVPRWVPTPQNIKERRVVKELKSVADDIIAKRRSENIAGEDILSRLLRAQEEKPELAQTESQIRDQAFTFLAAGHETTSNLISWVIYLLAQHPDWAEKMSREAQAFKAKGNYDLNRLEELSVSSRVINEAMRLYPPASAITRTNLESFELGGYSIPAKSIIVMPIYAIHRDPKRWDQPERFDPDRFLPNQIEAMHPIQFIPFGGGPRECIGKAFALAETKIILTEICSRFKFSLDAQSSVNPRAGITLYPKGGIWVRAEKLAVGNLDTEQMPPIHPNQDQSQNHSPKIEAPLV